jgi:uncharacterized SAM-binding protein YcdF (DUF218 family)
MTVYLVIFGAAVRPDGQPSGTLARRIEGALAAAKSHPFVRFICTGGISASGHVEAEVMNEILLRAGVKNDNIILERRGRDTLEQVGLCSEILSRANDVEAVIPCTSRYHLPRCALLMLMLGLPVRTAPMPSDWGKLQMTKFFWYPIRELIACPYDAALLLLKNRNGSHERESQPSP